MSQRRVYHVLPTDKGWKVQGEGAKQPSKTSTTKPPAIAAAKKLAKAAPLGQVKIHKQNGIIQTEYTYGEDPRRYPG